ncbi:MAG TPA: FkbM family methyltransferase [Terriglobales bacterium]|jgi:FkbM family methyltransferase|nr:FkbM family methyltransferase [Terriglobales bacterium]
MASKNETLSGAHFYYKTLGIRGFAAALGHYLFGWPEEVRVHPPGLKHPIFLRVRTSDVLVYNFVLLSKEYHVELPKKVPLTIVDAGANIGLTAIYFATQYPHARIIAIEPENSNYLTMLRNIAPYPNIVPIQAALWRVDGTVSLGLPNSDSRDKWAFSVTSSEGRSRAVTIPTLLSEFGIEKVDLLKIDIEGAEKEVFEECGWIDRIETIAIETHDRIKPGCTATVEKVTHGFDRWERGELTFYARRPSDSQSSVGDLASRASAEKLRPDSLGETFIDRIA